MVVNQSNSYSEVSENGVKIDMWNYGVELWCNLPGQYIKIVADLTPNSA